VPKAAVLAAVARAAGIPARLGYADVRNHMSTERLRQTMKTDVFVWHGLRGSDGVGDWATPWRASQPGPPRTTLHWSSHAFSRRKVVVVPCSARM
jgi:hypothetical protein